MMERQIEFDCVVCGITTVDLMLGPALLDKPLEKGALHYIDEVQAIVGGITSNSGTALSRLGMRTAVLGYLGNDIWAGYNLKTEEVVNMKEAGIIDPAKVTRTALESAASVAGTILLTECVVVEDPDSKDEVDPMAGMMGGMM